MVPPRDVDGATLFIPRNGPQLREFLFTDTEQAYQSTDLALLAHHLINRPIDMDFDQSGRLLHVVMADGTMATLTVFREEQVSAWTLQETAGAFRSVATVGDATYVLVERQPGLSIEVFDSGLAVDCGLSGTATSPRQSWSGLGALEGQTLKVLADGSVQADAVVTGGTVTLAEAAGRVQVGLAFKHVIEPLPLSVETVTATQSSKLRPVAVSFRFLDTCAFCLDIGKGPVDVPFKRFGSDLLDTAPRPFSGDKTVRTLGWRESGVDPLWRIEQDTPLPFTLLAVSTEVGIGG
jgi:hypothetical protein